MKIPLLGELLRSFPAPIVRRCCPVEPILWIVGSIAVGLPRQAQWISIKSNCGRICGRRWSSSRPFLPSLVFATTRSSHCRSPRKRICRMRLFLVKSIFVFNTGALVRKRSHHGCSREQNEKDRLHVSCAAPADVDVRPS